MNDSPMAGRSLAGLALVALGVLLKLGEIFNFSLFGLLWPLIIMVPGAILLYYALTGGKGQAGLAIPGSIITGLGSLLMYQNLTNHWESWAYAWLLIPVFLGLGLILVGRRTDDQGAYKAGQGFVRIGGIAFLALAALFELVIFGGGGILGSAGLPLLLIGAGTLMLFRDRLPGLSAPAHKSKRDEAPLFTGAAVVGAKAKLEDYGPLTGDRLQQAIDEALAEEDESGASNPTAHP